MRNLSLQYFKYIFFCSQKRGKKPGVVAHTCNPDTWEMEAGGSQIPGQAGQFLRPYLKTKYKQ
jgi:hypothetical protein